MNSEKKKYVLKSKKRFIIIISIIVITLLLIGGLAWGYSYIRGIAKGISTVGKESPGVTVTPISRPAPNNRINFLLVGVARGMSDTILLISFYPKEGTLDCISIPRDTYVKKSTSYDSAYNKINANYGRGGSASVLAVVKEFTKVDVNYYIEINYEAVEEIIDGLGGLAITVQEDMNYDDRADDLHIHFKKGTVVSKGADIVRVLRWRKNNSGVGGGYATGDIGRIQFQHEVIKQGILKILTGNPLITLTKIQKPLTDHVKTNISPDDIMYFVGLSTKINKDKITLLTLPGTGHMVGRLSFYLPYPKASANLFNMIINNEVIPNPLPESITAPESFAIPIGPVYTSVVKTPTPKPTPKPVITDNIETPSTVPTVTPTPTVNPTPTPIVTDSPTETPTLTPAPTS